MSKTLMVIKKSGKSYKCYTRFEVNKSAEALQYIANHRIARIQIMRRTKFSEHVKNGLRRIVYILKAIKTACSKEFNKHDINRRQSTEV